MNLRPCSGCNRHVALGETACPFCGVTLEATSPARDPLTRLSRAAIFVAGAAAATACWTSKSEPQHASATTSTVSTTAAASDAGVASDTAVTPDASTVTQHPIIEEPHYQNHPCVSPGPGQPPVCAPYGAPPARRRIV